MALRATVLAATAVLVLGLAGAAAAPAPVWPMLGHDRIHSGMSAVSGPTTAHLIWRYTLGSPVSDNASPVVGPDGTVYVGTDKSLFAVNPNGTLKWRKYGTSFDDLQAHAAPAVTPTAVYVVRELPPGDPNWPGAALTALKPSDGSLLWSYPIFHASYGSPTIGSDGTIYVAGSKATNDGSGVLYAIRPNGTVRWAWSPNDPAAIETAPAVTGSGDVYVNHNGLGLVRLNSSGQFQWSQTLVGQAFNQPAIASGSGVVYIGASNHYFYAVNPNGTIKWGIPVLNFMYLAAASTDGTRLFRGDNGGVFYAFDVATHTIAWKLPLGGGAIYSTPAVASGNGLVYFASENGYLYARKTTTGAPQWRFFVGTGSDSSPALAADGTLYAVTPPGRLIAFK